MLLTNNLLCLRDLLFLAFNFLTFRLGQNFSFFLVVSTFPSFAVLPALSMKLLLLWVPWCTWLLRLCPVAASNTAAEGSFSLLRAKLLPVFLQISVVLAVWPPCPFHNFALHCIQGNSTWPGLPQFLESPNRVSMSL